MNVVHYGLSLFMLIMGMHMSMYVFTSLQSATYFIVLIIFNVITADSSLRVASIDVIMFLYFLILSSEKESPEVFSADIAIAIIVTLLCIGMHMVIMNFRCQSYFMLKHSSEKYRKDSASANAELKQSMKSIEVLSALSADFENIMYIDLNNNKILKFFSDSLVDKSDADLTKLSYGEYVNMFTERLVYEEDRAYVKEQFYPRGLILSLSETKVVLVRYRVQINGEIKYYESKIIPDTSSDNKFMVIAATHDIDAETRRYMEYSTKLHETEVLATSDMLTGVKNKTAYFRTEREYNNAIEHGEKVKFAIIMCDVNNLKTTNDTLGHEAGDKLIKTACGKICSVFGHSPVFRIGGDEFVIVATGSDYDDRVANFEKLRKMAAEATDGITFASGMSVYNSDSDFVFNDVFARADSEMYENKKSMKAKRGETPRREKAERGPINLENESPAELIEKLKAENEALKAAQSIGVTIDEKPAAEAEKIEAAEKIDEPVIDTSEEKSVEAIEQVIIEKSQSENTD
ncbi:MAG: GGDEF domain-containing protein [Lachnospiraceae bacterium]|nr:GGDEF domain-containing protein [Lachnospiraceae bacterium]